MNYKLLAVCAAAALGLSACASNRHDRAANRDVNEPAGAYATNSNRMPDLPARDINQRPYPGVDPNYNEWPETGTRSPSGYPMLDQTVPDPTPENDSK